MGLTRLALSNPVAVVAAILMLLLMGAVGLANLPIQMIPDVQRPFIQITTGWRSAAPEEVESEIVEPQEDVLRGIPGLEKMESSASRGLASINLTFTVGIDLQRALLEVINRLNHRRGSRPGRGNQPTQECKSKGVFHNPFDVFPVLTNLNCIR